MIGRISISNFKGIQKLDLLSLGSFCVLVGPNASGKTTFLSAIELIRSCIQNGPRQAVEELVPAFADLTFMRRGGPIQLMVRMDLDAGVPSLQDRTLFYGIRLSEDEKRGVRVEDEALVSSDRNGGRQRGTTLAGRTRNGKCFYRRESSSYTDVFDFGPDKLALSLTPPDETRYPAANAAKTFLTQGVRYIQLNSRAMREPCPATRPTELELDGTNLARVVGRLARASPNNTPAPPGVSTRAEKDPFRRWTEHLRYAIDDLKEIGWGTRQPDSAEYVTLKYTDGLECPSWLLSDGTLRMLALTLPAFLPAAPGIYMVEEPENGVHPKALEIILKALAAIPGAQVFVATHSPLVVQQAGVEPLLCFSRDDEGVHVVRGKDHPVLKDWKGVPDLGSVFSSRVLG